MNKLRNDSVFSQLTPEQVETLEGWLFEENLGYKEALERVQKEFNVQGSLTGLRRFYRRLAEGRNREDFAETLMVCMERAGKEGTMGTLQAGLLAMATQRAVDLLVEAPGKIREFTALLRVIISAQGMEMKRKECEKEEARVRKIRLEKQREEAEQLENNRRWSEMNAAREAKRKATIAAKKALESSKAHGPMTKEAPNSKIQEVEEKGLTEGPIERPNDIEQGATEKPPMTNLQCPSGNEQAAPEGCEKAGGVDGASILTLPESAAPRPKKLSPEEAALRGGCFRIVGMEKGGKTA